MKSKDARELVQELAGSVVGEVIPLGGTITKRLLGALYDEVERNRSKALKAAVIVSGLTVRRSVDTDWPFCGIMAWWGRPAPSSAEVVGVAGRGRPQRGDIERFACPWPGHARRPVGLHGVVKNKLGVVTRQRYLCSPGTTKAHTFSIPTDAQGRPALTPVVSADGAQARGVDARRPYAAPEPCPEHAGGTVIRRGSYKTGLGSRQRYQCTPVGWYPEASRVGDPDHARHTFTPILPRAHVEGDSACPHCAELRATNRGETAIARWHQATTGQVAGAMERLGRGESYADVSAWLQGELRSDGASPKKKNGWRRAADLVELFSPVVWDDWLAQVGQEEADRDPSARVPRVVMVDDLPIFEKARGRRRQQQRFAVLGLAEVAFHPSSGQPRDTRLRLLRAFPSHSTEAYTLLLDDLGYVPDFVIADGGKGIEPAVQLLAARTGCDVTFITSAFHTREQLRRVIDKARGVKPTFAPGDVARQVEAFGPTQSRQAWERWWIDYEALLTSQGVPRSGWPDQAKKESYQRTLNQLDALAPWPDVPRSTGGLESLLARYVKPSIKRRGAGFGNLVRTNALLDLFVLRANGYFDNPARVIAALRADAVAGDARFAGFAPPVRAIADAGRDRSLLDPSVLTKLISNRGLDILPAPVSAGGGR